MDTLFHAVGDNDLKLLEELLKSGAEPNVTDSHQRTPLYFVKSVEAAKLLLDFGADINAGPPSYRADPGSPLSAAAQSRLVDVVRFFLECGAEVDKTHHDGSTPLQVIAFTSRLSQSEQLAASTRIVELLLSHGADPNPTSTRANPHPLIHSAAEGTLGITKALLDHGADVNVTKTIYEGSPLAWAAREGHTAVVEELIARGANINIQSLPSDGGETALQEATRLGHAETAKLLIEKGADLNIRNAHGQTALAMAVFNGHQEIAHALIAAGADLTQRYDDSRTVLMSAAYQGQLEIVKALLDMGINVSHRDSHGKTAEDYAKENGWHEICAMLQTASLSLMAQQTELTQSGTGSQNTRNGDDKEQLSESVKKIIRRAETNGTFIPLGQKVTAMRGWQWIVKSYQMLREDDYFQWIPIMAPLFISIVILVHSMVYGLLVMGALFLFINGAVILKYSCTEEETDISGGILGVLFSDKRTSLFIVWVVLAIAACLSVIVASQAAGIPPFEMFTNMDHWRLMPMETRLVTYPLCLVLMIPALMASWFAPALIIIHDFQPMEAMKRSILVCAANSRAFVVLTFVPLLILLFACLPAFMLYYFELLSLPAFAVGILPVVFLFVLCMFPMLAMSIHISYREVFFEAE